jgi:hypothetical protein
MDVTRDIQEQEAAIGDWIDHLQQLLSLPPGGALALSVLQCGVRYAHRLLGYVHALSAADAQLPPLVRGPLVAWDGTDVDAAELTETLEALIQYLQRRNPVVQRYKTMAERKFGAEQVRRVALPITTQFCSWGPLLRNHTDLCTTSTARQCYAHTDTHIDTQHTLHASVG